MRELSFRLCVIGLALLACQSPPAQADPKDDEITALRARLKAEVERGEYMARRCEADLAALKAVQPSKKAIHAAHAAMAQGAASEAAAARPNPQIVSAESVAASCATDSPTTKKASAPTSIPRYVDRPTGGDDKADSNVVALDFPSVPSDPRWLEFHLAVQWQALEELYQPGALNGLAAQEKDRCRNPTTRLFCSMWIRMHWILYAVAEDS